MRKAMWAMPAMIGLVLAAGQPAVAQTTMATLLDRIQIEEMVTDYYSQLGRPKTKNFVEAYTEDAELVLGTRTAKGKAAIEAIYASMANANPGKPRPPMNMLLTNPRISVTGDTAHGEFIYTGIVIEAADKAPVLHEQGREIDEFVKVNGVWKIRKRTIVNDANAGMGVWG